MNRGFSRPIILVFLGAWLGTTLLVDFVVAPTIFGIIRDFFNAGELGMNLFTRYNNIEMVFATYVLLAFALHLRRTKKSLVPFISATVLWMIVMIYFSWLIPKISELTVLWQKADAAGSMAASGIADIQQAHQYYHRLYVGLDSFKILLLSFLTGWAVFKEELWA